MLIEQLGEFGLIERIKKTIRTDPSVIKGIGDDCAVIDHNVREYLLLTADMLVEKVDFTLRDKPYWIGHKALAVSLSDIAACGGLPRYALVSLGVPVKTRVRFIDEMYRGMRDLAKRFGVTIVGGDLSRAPAITIDVSLAGFVEKNKLVLRSGAALGDQILVSGKLGGALKSGRHLKFIPRVKEARFLVENFKVSSMIDISDGLLQDLSHILKASNTGALIYERLLPRNNDAGTLAAALSAGEDFELLFTMPPRQAKRLAEQKRDFRVIGEIVHKKNGFQLVDRQGVAHRASPAGFRHF
ncbi:MAG: thiamine-phosphate kinase [Candidatus Omnitrophota bacterium]|jgi:thiamine-monophosphate kinase